MKEGERRGALAHDCSWPIPSGAHHAAVRRILIGISAAALLGGSGGTAAAQSVSPTGTLQGRVFGATAGVADAVVIIDSVTSVRTSNNGSFAVHRVQPGRHLIRVLQVGYEQWRDSVDVTAGQTAEVVVHLVEVRQFVVMTDSGRPRPAEADTAPSGKEEWDPIVRAMQMEPLRLVRRRKNYRELRFWFPPVMSAMGTMVRLVAHGRNVDALLYHVWALDTRTDTTASSYISPAELRRRGCTDIGQREVARLEDTLVAGGCRLPLAPGNWRSLLKKMEMHHVWTLPDESEITRSTSIVATDAVVLIVEALDGLRYHTYQYGAPEIYDNAETKDATALIQLVESVMRARRRPIGAGR